MARRSVESLVRRLSASTSISRPMSDCTEVSCSSRARRARSDASERDRSRLMRKTLWSAGETNSTTRASSPNPSTLLKRRAGSDRNTRPDQWSSNDAEATSAVLND